jgi:hypothetical protein
VENPVEKIHQTAIAVEQSEEFSGLHHRGAIHNRVNVSRSQRKSNATCCHQPPAKPTDYTVTTS